METQPVIDGKFCLEEITIVTEHNHPLWPTSKTVETELVIHLPALPERDGLTREYKIVG